MKTDEKFIERITELAEYARHSSKRYRLLKLLLLEEFGTCYWCGIKVKDYGKLPIGTSNPSDMATIDHLVSRFHRQKGETVLKVLACAHCNEKRSHEENKLYGNEHRNKLKSSTLTK